MHELLPFIVGIALAIMAIPAAGYAYGKLTGAGGDVESDASVWDTAVSKGLESRRDTEPEDTNDE